MDFHLTKEQLLVRKMYREFAENEVKPLAAEIDEEERFPMETVEKMAKLGMMGIYFPKEYGGAGGDVLSYAMCVEELAKVCGTTAVIVSAHTSLCCAPIFEHGTEAQKQKYLPDLLSGKKIGAFGLTEPGAGTDAQGQQTTAVLDESGENYILNGSKCFITNGNVALWTGCFTMPQAVSTSSATAVEPCPSMATAPASPGPRRRSVIWSFIRRIPMWASSAAGMRAAMS